MSEGINGRAGASQQSFPLTQPQPAPALYLQPAEWEREGAGGAGGGGGGGRKGFSLRVQCMCLCRRGGGVRGVVHWCYVPLPWFFSAGGRGGEGGGEWSANVLCPTLFPHRFVFFDFNLNPNSKPDTQWKHIAPPIHNSPLNRTTFLLSSIFHQDPWIKKVIKKIPGLAPTFNGFFMDPCPIFPNELFSCNLAHKQPNGLGWKHYLPGGRT